MLVPYCAANDRLESISGHSLPSLFVAYDHTYIIGHYNLSVGIIDLVSQTTYVVCANFIHKGLDLQF